MCPEQTTAYPILLDLGATFRLDNDLELGETLCKKDPLSALGGGSGFRFQGAISGDAH